MDLPNRLRQKTQGYPFFLLLKNRLSSLDLVRSPEEFYLSICPFFMFFSVCWRGDLKLFLLGSICRSLGLSRRFSLIF